MRRTDEDHVNGREHHEQRADQVSIVKTSGEYHRGDDQHQCHRGAEIGFEQNQRHHRADDNRDWEQGI